MDLENTDRVTNSIMVAIMDSGERERQLVQEIEDLKAKDTVKAALELEGRLHLKDWENKLLRKELKRTREEAASEIAYRRSELSGLLEELETVRSLCFGAGVCPDCGYDLDYCECGGGEESVDTP